MALAERSVRSAVLEPTPGLGPGVARRALDVILSLVALVLLLVPMLLIAGAVRVTSPGPALFAQVRIGQGGRPFRLLKFRSMRAGAGGSALTAPGDSRITPLGRVLRASCIDELPQLINVLLGDMTLVGPRPQTPGFAERYPQQLRAIFAFRPGLTGPGVIRFNDDDVLPRGARTTRDVEDFYLRLIVPRRVEADLAYCADPTLLRTLGILAATAWLAVRRAVPRRSRARSSVTGLPSVSVIESGAAVAARADDGSMG